MRFKNIVLTLLTVIMLLLVAVAVPLGTVTDAAQEQYAEDIGSDDAVDFL